MNFKPKTIPTVITALGLLLLISLGSWQMQRLKWKTTLINEINQTSSNPAIDLPIGFGSAEELKYKRVKLKGTFVHDKEVHLFVGSRSPRGRAGYNILTPLLRDDGTYVLVDRGWVDSDHKKPEKRTETLISEVVEIEGVVYSGEKPGRFTPDNDVKKNLWFWIDLDEIKNYTGFNLQNFYVRALKKDTKNVYPIASDETIKIRNNHLEYAMTWYSLAIILLVIYFMYHRKNA